MLQRWLVVIIGLPLLLAALLLCPDWVTVIVVCGIAAAAAYELLHTAGKKVPKCVYAFTILAAVAQEWVIYDELTWQFYEGYQSVGMIRILCVPLVLQVGLLGLGCGIIVSSLTTRYRPVFRCRQGLRNAERHALCRCCHSDDGRHSVPHDVQRHFPAADGRAVR